MFFNDDSKIKINCVIRVKYLYPRFIENRARRMRPPASWAGLRHRRTLWACVCASGVASAPLEIVIGTTRPCAAMGNSRKQWIFIDFH